MSLNNCEINLFLSWSENCLISAVTWAAVFIITDAKLYVPVVTFSTQDNLTLLRQLKLGFNWISWNKHKPKVLTKAQY